MFIHACMHVIWVSLLHVLPGNSSMTDVRRAGSLMLGYIILIMKRREVVGEAELSNKFLSLFVPVP